jgi:flagellar motor switch protein FliM
MSDYELTPQELAALTTGKLPDASPAAATAHEASRVPNQPATVASPPATVAPPSNENETSPSWDRPLRAVYRSLMESFAAGLASQLCAPLRTDVSINVESIREAIFGELTIRMDNPTCVQLLDVTLIDGQQVFEMHPTVLFPMFDRLLGGGKLPASAVRRPLTEIENRLAGRVTRIVLAELEEAWRPILQVEASSVQLLCNPRMLRCENPSEPMIVTQFQLSMADCQGPLQLAVRRDALVELKAQMLSPRSALSENNQTASVIVAELDVAAAQMDHLTVGDVLLSDQPAADGSATVYINEDARYSAKLGTLKGKKAVEIQAPVGD